MTSQWFAIRTATRRERAAVANLHEQSFTAFLPCETRWRRLGGTKESVRRPLFDGYLFVLCEPHEWARIHDTEGVHDFVRVVTREGPRLPAAFPDEAIRELFLLDWLGELDRTKEASEYRATRGDKVAIIGGRFGALAYVGTVLSVSANERRALVHLENGFKLEEDLQNLVEAA